MVLHNIGLIETLSSYSQSEREAVIIIFPLYPQKQITEANRKSRGINTRKHSTRKVKILNISSIVSHSSPEHKLKKRAKNLHVPNDFPKGEICSWTLQSCKHTVQ